MWSLAGVIFKVVLSWVTGLITGRIQRAQDRLQGMKDQKAADDQATIEAATKAARAGSEVAGESDSEVVNDLSKDFRP